MKHSEPSGKSGMTIANLSFPVAVRRILHNFSRFLYVYAVPIAFAISSQVFASPEISSFESTATQENFGLYFPVYLANGYFSITTSLRGTDSTPSYMIGLMDHTAEDISRPSAIPSWGEINYFDGDSWLNSTAVTPAAFLNYRQTLNRYDGRLETNYLWKNGTRSTRIAVQTFVSEASNHIGSTSMTLTPDFDGVIRLRFTLRPHPSPLYRLQLATMTRPEKDKAVAEASQKHLIADLTAPDITDGPVARRPEANPLTSPNRAAQWYPGEAKVDAFGGDDKNRLLWIQGHSPLGPKFSEAAAIALPTDIKPLSVSLQRSPQLVQLEVSFQVTQGHSYTFTKFVSAARDGWGDIHQTRAQAQEAREIGFAALLEAHKNEWHRIWKSDIVVEGDDELQRAVHADLFSLLENSTVNTRWAIQGMGLSPIYGGHVAWDCDSWHFPVLLLLHPERARSVVNYRYRVLPEAERNAQRHGYRGAMYAWESDPENGTETTPFFAKSFADREVHMTADVAIAQWQYYLATGDKAWLRDYGFPVIRSVADFWVSRSTFNADHNRYEILHVTSPDEAYDDVNNDSFTNAVAQKALRAAVSAANLLATPADPKWSEVAEKMYIPFSEAEQRHLDFDESVQHNKETWMGSSISWLAYPPLDLSMSDKVRQNDFDFATKALRELTPDANDMVPVILGIVASELGKPEEADRWLRFSLNGFLKPPFDVRSETPRNNTLYILCVSGGFLENFLYGFTGLRFTDDGLKQVYPALLPTHVRRIVLRNIGDQGKRYDFIVECSGEGKVTLTRKAAMPE
jgi:protein-glucosylgalactosylhydroxylysine glucosidase